MPTEPKNIGIHDTTFRQLQEMAEREGKPVDDLADEIVQNGTKSDLEKRLLDLAEYGQRQAEKLYPGGLTEDDIVDIIHRRREANRKQ